jgi:hypothetical protein
MEAVSARDATGAGPLFYESCETSEGRHRTAARQLD